jgi:hypothetical protein
LNQKNIESLTVLEAITQCFGHRHSIAEIAWMFTADSQLSNWAGLSEGNAGYGLNVSGSRASLLVSGLEGSVID